MTPPEWTPEMTLLVTKYLDGTASAEERRVVLDWYRSVDLYEIHIPVSSETEMEELRLRVRQVLDAHVAAGSRTVTPLWRKLSAVAAVVLLVAGGLWLLVRHRVEPAPEVVGVKGGGAKDVLPGHSGAILTLADGSTKVLDSLHAGVVAVQGKTTVKLQSGQLSYLPAGSDAGGLTYNTMTTPRGREYQLVLPDRTKVWLNAASSLTYPTAFLGNDRTVVLNGEAYFEVKHDSRPFMVRAGGQTIRDLGTEFNVNDYTDEPAIVTTLVAGSVSVNRVLIRPGQQAVSGMGSGSADSAAVAVSAANVPQAIAWKNGQFSFSNATLPVVLRQLARWYDFTVEFRGKPSTKLYSGEIGRSLTLGQLLRILTRSNVQYEIEHGNKLIILPGEE